MKFEKHFELIDDIMKTVCKEKSKEFGEFIFSIVKEFYDNTLTTSNKPKINEWTVYSSIILQNKEDFKIIVFTNGTKSVPNKNYRNRKYSIHDCHAEILALRCLRMFIGKCLIFNMIENNICNLINEKVPSFHNSSDFLNDFIFTNFMSSTEYETFNSNRDFFNIFHFPSNSKIMLKENVLFHLYISESPCGDASIYPCCSDDTNQTGSKTIEEVLQYLISNSKKMNHDNSISKVRSKSMRSDITHECISYSLSCSDKLLIKNFLGLQGVYLAEIIQTIHLSSILISIKKDSYLLSYDNIISSVNRGLSIIRRDCKRLSLLDKSGVKNIINEPMINLTFKNLDESSFSRTDKNALSFSSYWYYGKSNITKLDPITGQKLGTSIKNMNYQKSGVDISDFSLFVIFLQILQLHSLIPKKIINNKKLNFLVKKLNCILSSNINTEDLINFLMDKLKLECEKYNNKKKLINKILEIEDFIQFKKNSFKSHNID
jgi:hypothetical protein